MALDPWYTQYMIKNENTIQYTIQEKLYDLLARHPEFNVTDFCLGLSNISNALYKKLFNRYLCAMPYGTANGRDGDPFVFVTDKLVEELYQIERGF